MEKKIIGVDYLYARASSVEFHDIKKKRKKEEIVKAVTALTIISHWQKQVLLPLKGYKFGDVHVT